MSGADPPIGLAYLASYIRERGGFDVKIFDQMKDSEIKEKVEQIRPEVIGITAVSSNYYHIRDFGKSIKKISPSSTLIIGGVHITTSPECFKDSPFDIAIIGEGEIPFLKVLKSINENKGLNQTNHFKKG